MERDGVCMLVLKIKEIINTTNETIYCLYYYNIFLDSNENAENIGGGQTKHASTRRGLRDKITGGQ